MSLPLYWDETSPVESMTRKGFQAKRTILCAWADRFTVKSMFLTWPPPMYPYDAYWAAPCTGISDLQGVGDVAHEDSETMRNYTHCRMVIEYATPGPGDPIPYPSAVSVAKNNDPACSFSEDMEVSFEALKQDPSKFKWALDNKAIKDEEAPVIWMFKATYVLKRHGLLTVPTATFSLLGCTNSAPVTMINPIWGGMSFPKWTLLYEPNENIHVYQDPAGVSRCDVEYRFHYREEDWYHFYRADKNIFDYMKVRETGDDVEWPNEADFSPLFP